MGEFAPDVKIGELLFSVAIVPLSPAVVIDPPSPIAFVAIKSTHVTLPNAAVPTTVSVLTLSVAVPSLVVADVTALVATEMLPIITSENGSIITSVGGLISTDDTGTINFGADGTRTAITGTATANRAIAFPDADGTLALTTSNVATATALATGRTIAITGDLAYISPSFNGTGNVTAAGTLATVNSNVGSFGSATQSVAFTVNAKGLVTAASATTITPAIGSVTGLAANVATFLATPSSANLRAALTDPTGSGGGAVFANSPTITTPTIAQINGGTAANDGLTLQGTTNATRTTSYVNLQPNGGNVGIGTATPTALLHVEQNQSGATGIKFINSNAAGFAAMYFNSGLAESTGGFLQWNNTTGVENLFLSTAGLKPLYIGSNNQVRMTVSSAGGVSIGTTTDAGATNLLVVGTITTNSSLNLPKTITAAATTGAQTINKPSGSVNFAAAATSLVVTNSLCTTSSVIMVSMGTNDATANGLRVVAAAGSFTIHLATAPTAETRVNFLLTN